MGEEKKDRFENMVLTIRIDGESAQNLFAVGPNDLKDYFFPEQLNVATKDIVQINFEAVDPEKGKPYYIVHKDNYNRSEKKVG